MSEKQTDLRNYFDDIMLDVFDLAASKKRRIWDEELTINNKISLLERIIDYFQEHEDYEKCDKLQKKINRMRTH
jgi:hypothetical protein